MITWAVTQELPAPSAAALLRFLAMCVGMFMGVLDIQIVATSLQAIDTALAIPPKRMS